MLRVNIYTSLILACIFYILGCYSYELSTNFGIDLCLSCSVFVSELIANKYRLRYNLASLKFPSTTLPNDKSFKYKKKTFNPDIFHLL